MSIGPKFLDDFSPLSRFEKNDESLFDVMFKYVSLRFA